MTLRLTIYLFLIWECAVQDILLNAEHVFRIPMPNGNSQEYGLQTIYTASAFLPMDNTERSPDELLKIMPEKKETHYFFVTSKRNETILPIYSPPKFVHRFKNLSHEKNEKQNVNYALHNQEHYLIEGTNSQTQDNYDKYKTQNNSPSINRQQQKYRRLRRRKNKNNDCIKCPPEKILIAQKGFDCAIIDQPKLLSCNNKAILNTAYYVETLFGPNFKFLLPQGTHTIHGRIKNKNTAEYVQTCLLRYKVIVKQCEKFSPLGENINVKCDPGQIWGSKCTFTCQRGNLSTNSSVVCGDNLQWEGEEPKCLLQSSLDKNQPCDFLNVPKNGRLSCEYPRDIKAHNFRSYSTKAPAGTICRVKCNRNYEIPPNLHFYNESKCQQGKWSTTALNICQLKRTNNSYI